MTGNSPSAEDTAKFEEAFQLLDKFLEGQDWVAGNNITIADYALAISASFAEVSWKNLSFSTRFYSFLLQFYKLQKTV